MERHFETELRELKEMILAMGGRAEKAIEEATQALILREPERFERVYQIEKEINTDHIKVDEASIKLLARQSPLAADLRLVVAVIKINTDLERIGDQAVNISHNGKRYVAEPPIKPLIDIPRMAQEVCTMVREALDAFVQQDHELARRVLNRDDSVDALKNQIFRELLTFMIADPKTIERALNLILIARNLERIGDHATNIAEDVIYAVTGKDIRHGAHPNPSSSTN
ncbi:phosphate signaling complex protein PhoU [bacterium]|jgi:phosphate transport system protein|nr:phosphate signaling complex protein PhoU [bacterium]